MSAWRPLAGLIRSLSAFWRVTRHSSAACGFHPQTDTGSCPPTLGLEVGFGCSQISWTTSSVSTRTATRTRSRSCTSSVAQWCSSRRSSQTTTATHKRWGSSSEHAPGRRVFAIEGTGSFGAGLTRFLTGRGERVLEVGRLRRERRSGGKTDALDAVRAARSVLSQQRPSTPRAGGERQALQALVAAREGAVNAKRAGLCQLRDLLITTPEPLRSELRPLTRARLLQRLAATRPHSRPDAELRGSLLALRSIARRVLH